MYQLYGKLRIFIRFLAAVTPLCKRLMLWHDGLYAIACSLILNLYRTTKFHAHSHRNNSCYIHSTSMRCDWIVCLVTFFAGCYIFSIELWRTQAMDMDMECKNQNDFMPIQRHNSPVNHTIFGSCAFYGIAHLFQPLCRCLLIHIHMFRFICRIFSCMCVLYLCATQ